MTSPDCASTFAEPAHALAHRQSGLRLDGHAVVAALPDEIDGVESLVVSVILRAALAVVTDRIRAVDAEIAELHGFDRMGRVRLGVDAFYFAGRSSGSRVGVRRDALPTDDLRVCQ